MEENGNYIKGCKELEYKNYHTAIGYFSKAIEENPNDLESLIKRADTYFEIEDYDKWENDLLLQSKIYTKQLKEDRNNYELLFKRAEIYRYLNRNIKATKDYEKAIKINPEYVEAYIGLGHVKMHQGRNELNQALTIFLKAINLQPDNSQALFYIALIYNRKENSEKAIEYYKKCIATKGDYLPVAYRSLSGLYYKMKRYNDAIACLKEFLTHNFGFDSDYSSLASFYEKAGNIDEAIFNLHTAISINSSNPYTYFDLSNLYVKLDDFVMALENVNYAIKLENRKSFLQHKAKLLLKLNKYDEALKTIEDVWKCWQLDYRKLKRLALKNGVDINEISSETGKCKKNLG